MQPDRPSLLLLHGALGAASQLAPLAAILGDRFEIHRIDFEGHGAQPDRDRPFTIVSFAENVISFLDEQAIGRCNIFGHSMGGYVGVYLAREQPERVAQVFTIGTKWDWSEAFAEREVGNMDADKIEQKVPHFAQALQERHTGSDWRTNLAKSRDMTLQMGSRPPLTFDDMSSISQPVRIGVGDRDRMTTLEESVAAYRALGNGQLQVFPDTQHPIERVDPHLLCAAVCDFFLND